MKKQFNEEEEAKRLVQKLDLNSPSENFTANVMEGVFAWEARKKIGLEYKPPITLRGWLAIAISFVILILITSLPAGNGADLIPEYLDRANKAMGWMDNFPIPSVSPVLVVIVLASWGLYLIDKYLFRLSRI